MFVRSITILFILLAGLSIAIPKTTQAQLVCDEAAIKKVKKSIDSLFFRQRFESEQHELAMKHWRAAKKALANNNLETCKKRLKKAIYTFKRL